MPPADRTVCAGVVETVTDGLRGHLLQATIGEPAKVRHPDSGDVHVTHADSSARHDPGSAPMIPRPAVPPPAMADRSGRHLLDHCKARSRECRPTGRTNLLAESASSLFDGRIRATRYPVQIVKELPSSSDESFKGREHCARRRACELPWSLDRVRCSPRKAWNVDLNEFGTNYSQPIGPGNAYRPPPYLYRGVEDIFGVLYRRRLSRREALAPRSRICGRSTCLHRVGALGTLVVVWPVPRVVHHGSRKPRWPDVPLPAIHLYRQ